MLLHDRNLHEPPARLAPVPLCHLGAVKIAAFVCLVGHASLSTTYRTARRRLRPVVQRAGARRATRKLLTRVLNDTCYTGTSKRSNASYRIVVAFLNYNYNTATVYLKNKKIAPIRNKSPAVANCCKLYENCI